MAGANVVQHSFLGGEWSSYAQGRFDLPSYSIAMNVCLNNILLQEGPAGRRPGFLRMGATRGGYSGQTRPFILPNNQPGYLEFTYNSGASVLQIWVADSAGSRYARFCDETRRPTAISTASPAAVTVGATETWATGDAVVFNLDPANSVASIGILGNQRAFKITVTNSTHFTIKDDVTAANIDGTTLSFSSQSGDLVGHVLRLALPYTTLADLQATRVVQADNLVLLLNRNYAPKALYYNGTTFAIADAGYSNWDGPYLDPYLGTSQAGYSLGHLSDYGATPTFTLDDTSSYTFVAGDVGKPFRVFIEPPAWDASVDYTALTATARYVTYNGAYWKLNNGNSFHMPVGTPPGNSYNVTDSGKTLVFVPWDPAPQSARWLLCKITGFTSATVVTLANMILDWPDPAGNFDKKVDIWRIGAFGTGRFPSCGGYHEGRLWLSGAWENRFDGSISGSLDLDKVKQAGGIVPIYSFAPTDRFGNVGDASAVSGTVNDAALNTVLWFAMGEHGMVLGTPGGEFLVSASAINDPLTPTSIQAHKVTRYKCANVEPHNVGNATIFVQSFGRRVMEYFPDAFSGRFGGRHINEYAGQMTPTQVAELAYQEDRTPVLWARRTDGALIGCTYRRQSNFASEPPLFTAWHRHAHGRNHTFVSICSGPSPDGKLDNLVALTTDPITGYHQMEYMTPLPDEAYLLPQFMHVDGSIIGAIGTEGDGGGGGGTIGVAGKYYFELTVTAGTTGTFGEDIGYGFAFGIAAGDMTLTNTVNLGVNLPQAGCTDGVFVSGGGAGLGAAVYWGYPFRPSGYLGTPYWEGMKTGDSVGVAVDTVSHLVWFRNASRAPTNWNGSTSADPATGVGGIDFSSLGASPIAGNIYIVAGGINFATSDYAIGVLNSGHTSFSAAAPSGFSAWDTTTATTFNPSDNGGLVLTNGNLTFDASALAIGGQASMVRTLTAKAQA